MLLGAPDFEELERRVASRDRVAFAALHRAYEKIIYQFVISKGANRNVASTITSAIFDKAWEACDRYPWRDFSFHVWLLRIARKELEDRSLPG